MSPEKKNNNKTEEVSVQSTINEERKYMIWTNKDFYLRESYKTLRSNVLFSMADHEGCHIIAVTSAGSSEGKSITTVNLAMSFADTAARVLLIDCDLRKPKTSRLLNLAADKGLTDVLVRRTSLSEAILRPSPNRPLWVLSAGRIPPNPSELLNSSAMKALLDKLRERYDYIILDTPPVEVVTDAMVLSKVADGYIFVVRANQSDRRAVRHSLDQLAYAGANVLGTVLNGSAEVGGGYGYKRYGYRRYGYRYGYSRYGYGRYGYGYQQKNDSSKG